MRCIKLTLFFISPTQPSPEGGLSRFAPDSAPGSAPGSIPGSVPGSFPSYASGAISSAAPNSASDSAPGSVPGGAPGATGWRFSVSATPCRLYCRLRSVSYAGCMSWQNYVSHQIQAWHRNKGNLSSHN